MQKFIQQMETYYSPLQLAKAFGVTRRTIYQWIANGYIPATRFAYNVVRIKASDVEAFTERRTRETIQEVPI